jgi:hypothetical protein
VPRIPAAQSRSDRAAGMRADAISHARPIMTFGSGTFAKYMIVFTKKNRVSLHWTVSKLSHCQHWENFGANR